MATSGSITGRYSATGAAGGLSFTIALSWTVTFQSFALNTTTIEYRLTVPSKTGLSNLSGGVWNINIDGKTFSGQYNNAVTSGTELTSGTVTIPHNSDGTKTFNLSASYGTTSLIRATASGTGILNGIVRPAIAISGQDFHDEQNPVLTYTNPSGSMLSKIQACIVYDDDSGDILADYRDIPLRDVSFTFELTQAEREAIWYKLSTTDWAYVRFYVKSFYKNPLLPLEEVAENYVIGKIRLANHVPVLNPEYRDINTFTTSLTGDPTKLIMQYSDVEVWSNAQAKKHAVLEIEQIACGADVRSNTNHTTFWGINADELTFTVKDSRNIFNYQTIYPVFVPYVKPSCHLKVDMISSTGNTKLTISGNCYYGSFGAVDNDVTISWRYRSNGAYSEWKQITATHNENNTYTAIVNVTNLDYRTLYTFEAKLEDSLEIAYSSEVKTRSIPTFDWSENDFNFNVPVTIQGDLTVDGHLVAASGSVPTLVEYGTSGGWTYRLWNDGIAECWRTLSISATIPNATAGWYSSGELSGTNLSFPCTFRERPSVNVSVMPTGNTWATIFPSNTAGTKMTTGSYQLMSTSAFTSSKSYLLSYQVRGYWT